MKDRWNKELKDAVWNNRPDLIKLCIQNGADVDWVGPGCMGRTQLYVSIIHERFDAAKALLEAGANPEKVDNCGKTPLQLGINSGYDELVALMKEKV